jgi:hypothetical protein
LEPSLSLINTTDRNRHRRKFRIFQRSSSNLGLPHHHRRQRFGRNLGIAFRLVQSSLGPSLVFVFLNGSRSFLQICFRLLVVPRRDFGGILAIALTLLRFNAAAAHFLQYLRRSLCVEGVRRLGASGASIVFGLHADCAVGWE